MHMISYAAVPSQNLLELSEDEITSVGGAGVPAVLAIAAGLLAVMDSAEGLGRKFGKALYHATHP